MKKILFLANIPTKNNKSIGGATVLAKNILEFLLEDNSLKITQKPLRKNWNKFGQIVDYLILSIKAPFIFIKYDIISIHATSDFHFTFSPIIWFWAKLFKKKIIYHFFGGNFYDLFSQKNPIHKFILKKTFLKSDTIFVETKMMIECLKKEGISDCVWLPNSRKESSIYTSDNYSKKFVFISRVTPTKGINEIIKASNKLSNQYQIDVYGPIDTSFYSENSFSTNNINYKGILQSELVKDVLKNYDVLLLPTYHKGEGYPGIIIESLSLGIPVITTKWRAIPEIINEKNGILIEPKNYNDLLRAILHFNNNNYKLYKTEALKSFKNFSSTFVFNKIKKSYLN